MGCVRPQTKARERFQRERERHAEVVGAGVAFAVAEGEGGGPTAKVAVHCVALFLEDAVAGVETVGGAETPVFV